MCLVKLVLHHIRASLPLSFDPHKFAYRANRPTEDAFSIATHAAEPLGAAGELRKDALYWLELSIQYSQSGHFSQQTISLGPHLSPLHLDQRLSHNWSTSRLCADATPLLPEHLWLYTSSLVQHHRYYNHHQVPIRGDWVSRDEIRDCQ